MTRKRGTKIDEDDVLYKYFILDCNIQEEENEKHLTQWSLSSSYLTVFAVCGPSVKHFKTTLVFQSSTDEALIAETAVCYR